MDVGFLCCLKVIDYGLMPILFNSLVSLPPCEWITPPWFEALLARLNRTVVSSTGPLRYKSTAEQLLID